MTKYDVLIENGATFGEAGAGYFRMTVACPRDFIKEGLDKIIFAIKDLEKENGK